MNEPTPAQIEAALAALIEDEELLSDGFAFYTDKTELRRIAKSIAHAVVNK